MTKLDNKSTKELYELLSLIENETIEEDPDLFNSKDVLIECIISDIRYKGYDGENNYDNMLWYVKGLHMPAPKKLTRYIDENDTYYFRNLKNNINRNRAKDDSYVRRKVRDYSTWKNKNEEQQKNIVNGIMEKLTSDPHNWTINFEELNDNGRMLLFPQLKNFFETFIAELPITGKYKVIFKVNGNYYSKPLSSAVFNKLMQNLTDKNFIFNIDDHPPEYFYEQGSMELPAWSLFSELSIKEIHRENNTYNDRGGSFFNFLVTDEVPSIVQKYLTKLQIFNSLVNERTSQPQQRKELDDCCFIYALLQTGEYTTKELNNMRLRVQNRYLSQKSIAALCEEFSIKVFLNYIDENAVENKKKRRVTTNGKTRSVSRTLSTNIPSIFTKITTS